MDRRSLGSIGLLLAGAGLYALVSALWPRSPAPDPAPGAPGAPGATSADTPARVASPTPSPHPPAAIASPPTPHPAPSPGLAGGVPPRKVPPPAVPPPIAPPPIAPPPVAPLPVAPPPFVPPRTEAPPAAPSPAARRILELVLEMRLETLRIHRALYGAGRVTQDAVDEAELGVIDARHDVAELTGPAWHRARAEVLARRAESVASEAIVGHVPQDVADLAMLDVARERALAGDLSDYATTRDAVLARSAARRRALVDAGRLSEREALAADLANEGRFPRLPDDARGPR